MTPQRVVRRLGSHIFRAISSHSVQFVTHARRHHFSSEYSWYTFLLAVGCDSKNIVGVEGTGEMKSLII
jgi:hypothetical protein